MNEAIELDGQIRGVLGMPRAALFVNAMPDARFTRGRGRAARAPGRGAAARSARPRGPGASRRSAPSRPAATSPGRGPRSTCPPACSRSCRSRSGAGRRRGHRRGHRGGAAGEARRERRAREPRRRAGSWCASAPAAWARPPWPRRSGSPARSQGGRALVCTIDPARRLANALGLAALGNVESRVPEHKFAEAGLPPRGELIAMMLDVKRTWDDLVTRHAPDPARRERILRNRLYQQMSAALAGSQEYMAMEKLYELATDRDYDLIVLDTPPTAHALDFLEAPDRILDFLGNETARALLAPALGAGQFGLRLAQLGGGYIAKTLARFTGQEVLGDLGDFLQGFQGMYDGFKERAAEVRALLSRAGGRASCWSRRRAAASIDEALAFHERLHAESMPIAGLVVNRLTPDLWPAGAGPLPAVTDLVPALVAAGAPGELAPRLATTLADHQALAAAERRALARLLDRTAGPQALVPRLETDVHDLAGLARLAEGL